jgi:hypothetical protein
MAIEAWTEPGIRRGKLDATPATVGGTIVTVESLAGTIGEE